MMKSIKNKLSLLFEINIFKTIYFNFKMLPLKQAIVLPITLTKRIQLKSLNGKIVINGPIKFALVKFRYFNDDFISKKGSYSLIKIRGKVIFSGKVDFGHGITLNVAKKGTIEINKNVLIGAKVKILCEDSVKIGKEARIAYESQIVDTNFHYVKNLERGECSKRTSPVIIGDYNWIGNRTTIQKGTITPAYTIIGSNSITNKDYTGIGENSIIAGVPAKFLANGFRRIFSLDEEFELNNHFNLKL